MLPPISIMLVAWHIGRRAAAPLVGQDDLLAVVAERRRCASAGSCSCRSSASRRTGFSGFEMSTSRSSASARAGEQVHRRIRRHVVAVARAGAASPGRGAASRRGGRRAARRGSTGAQNVLALRARPSRPVKMRAPGIDLGLLGVVERHLDDVEPEERVRRVGRVRAVLAPGDLRLRARAPACPTRRGR